MIGDKDHPLRSSKLAALCKCSMRIYLLGDIVDDEDDLGGEAAQIGSLTHKGVAEFHRVTKSLAERKKAAFDAIRDNAANFPLADLNECRLNLQPYIDDPRNQNAEILHHEVLNAETGKRELTPMIEYQAKFTLPPHPIDETGQPIHCTGTWDQVRIVNRIPMIHDLKTGKISAFQMIHDYTIQLCAYAYGARQIGITGCQPGKLIRSMGYRARAAELPSPIGVFIDMPPWKMVEHILENVRFNVALYRNGNVNWNTGPHCTYCEHGGIFDCYEKFEMLQLKLRHT